ncbi:MAG: glutathionylspermidine synthase family protein [Beijerinckiaceae bacterium]|nr:glutathionylspermidine synthase family protein [Beijerinckiaceae bacterium]
MRRLEMPERPDWRSKAEQVGFSFHSADDRPYWDETGAFGFTLEEIEEKIEAPSAELEEMALEFVGKACRDEEVLTRLAIPRAFWGEIWESWQRGDRNLYGRFDFAYDGQGPAKLLEYNADTPTALLETGVFQWLWLEEMIAKGALPRGSDQYNSVHDKLIGAFRNLRNGRAYRLHLTCLDDSEEDRATVAYLEECAQQAGLATQFLFVNEIGLTKAGKFVDLDEAPIEVLFKLYPWEWMMREEFGKAIPGCGTQFLEPIWKALLSNKGLLPYLWQMAPGHPNLVPAYFPDEPAPDLGPSYVEKPLFSREGANIRLFERGRALSGNDGPYGEEGFIRQQRIPIPDFGHGHVVLGAWMVASEPAGMLVREDKSPITGNLARFIPHFIEP